MATSPTPVLSKPRTIVYSDGLNLYYGAVRDAPALKSLDIDKLCRRLRPNDGLRAIKYFSAPIVGLTRPNQDMYLRPLATLPTVQVVLGRLKDRNVNCGVSSCTYPGDRWFKVPEET